MATTVGERCPPLSVCLRKQNYLLFHIIPLTREHSIIWYLILEKTELFDPLIFTRMWLRYVRVFAIAIPSVCRL